MSVGSGASIRERLAGDRVHKPKRLGVKRLARERNRESGSPHAAVDGIAHDRVVDLLEMNPDLMRASGLEPAGQQAGPDAELLDHFVMRDRRNAVLIVSGNAPAAVSAVRHQRQVDSFHSPV